MGFDIKKFGKTKFKARTMAVAVTSEALADFFNEKDKKEFSVKGLTGEELSRCITAHSRMKVIRDALEAILGSGKSNIEAIRELFSLGGESMEEDLARRIEMLALGCVTPKLDIQLAAKITKVAPVDAKNLTDHILLLSGQGMIPGGPLPSGDAETSEPVATLDIPGINASTS